jgi:non-heme chloroperoxidase
MGTYAGDLAELIESLRLNDVILVGHSAGGGEITRYMGCHGTARVSRAVLVGAVAPLMLRTDANPHGTPAEAFDAIRARVAADRSQFYQDLGAAFYGANRPGSAVSRGLRDAFWLMGMQVGLKAALDCIQAFSETDLTGDLERIDVPVFVAHGDDDQIVPIQAAGIKSAQILASSTLKVYPGEPHGLCGAYEQEFNADLLSFITS